MNTPSAGTPPSGHRTEPMRPDPVKPSMFGPVPGPGASCPFEALIASWMEDCRFDQAEVVEQVNAGDLKGAAETAFLIEQTARKAREVIIAQLKRLAAK